MATDVATIDTPRTEVVRAAPTVPELLQMADLFSQSGMFKDAKTVAEAFVKIQAGAEMGVQPFASMNGIHIIQGKPSVGAGLLASLLDAHPHYSYRVTWTFDPDGGYESACSVTISKHGTERGTATFSLADAQRAGLMSNQTWVKYPTSMLFARAMSNAVRWYAGAVTNGSPVYVDGEVEELEPVDLEELARKPSTEPMPRKKATKDEEKQYVDAARAKGLLKREVSKILGEHGEGPNPPWSDQIPAILDAIEQHGMDDIAAVTAAPPGEQEPAEVVPDAETLL